MSFGLGVRVSNTALLDLLRAARLTRWLQGLLGGHATTSKLRFELLAPEMFFCLNQIIACGQAIVILNGIYEDVGMFSQDDANLPRKRPKVLRLQ